LQGQVLALEPHFGVDLVIHHAPRPALGFENRQPILPPSLHPAAPFARLVFGGYDHSHQLNRTRRTKTFQNMTLGDIAQKVARNASIQTGTIDNVGGPRTFVQQNNETDWEFLWKLAKGIDIEV